MGFVLSAELYKVSIFNIKRNAARVEGETQKLRSHCEENLECLIVVNTVTDQLENRSGNAVEECLQLFFGCYCLM